MVGRLVKIFSILSATVLVIVPIEAGATEASRILLQDGTVYQDVAFIVDKEFKVVTVTKNSWERTVSFTAIAYIYDAKGEDITLEQLGMIYRKTDSIPPAMPGSVTSTATDTNRSTTTDAPAYSERPAIKKQLYPWKLAIRTAGNYSIPTGDFYDGFTNGIGFEGDLIIPTAKNIAVRLSASKSGIRDDPDRFFLLSGSSVELIEDNVSAHVLRFSISAEYYEWPRWREGGRWMYHLYSGIGIIDHSMSGEYLVRDKQSGNVGTIGTSSKNLTRLLLVFGFGAMSKINKHAGLDGSFEMDAVAIGSNPNAYSIYSAVDYAFIFDFKLGVIWLF